MCDSRDRRPRIDNENVMASHCIRGDGSGHGRRIFGLGDNIVFLDWMMSGKLSMLESRMMHGSGCNWIHSATLLLCFVDNVLIHLTVVFIGFQGIEN